MERPIGDIFEYEGKKFKLSSRRIVKVAFVTFTFAQENLV